MVRSLNSIVAVCQNMGIGKDGRLPWPSLRNEYRYFQRMTSTSHVEGKQNAVIMGRKTWFSIPEKNRPLKDRINIVLSRELKETPKGAHYLSKSLDDALTLLDSPELRSKVDMVWIIGGTSVYKAAMEKPINHRLFMTRILQEFESDTFFPEIDYKDYKLIKDHTSVSSPTSLHPTGSKEVAKIQMFASRTSKERTSSSSSSSSSAASSSSASCYSRLGSQLVTDSSGRNSKSSCLHRAQEWVSAEVGKNRYPGVPADIQEENGIQYRFEVYEKVVLAQ